MIFPNRTKKILLLSFSFSGQTSNLLRGLHSALVHQGHIVFREKIEPVKMLRFPTSGITACLLMMVRTCLRWRVPIKEISRQCHEDYDLIILAGPTWSYNPSGPILSLIDRDGPRIFADRTVIPLISCRGYWRIHWYGLRALLRKCGATVPQPMVFSHPNKEPWRTLGVFMKIAGKNPEKSGFLGKYYRRFGHSRAQQKEAERFGRLISDALINGTPLTDLQFRTPRALP